MAGSVTVHVTVQLGGYDTPPPPVFQSRGPVQEHTGSLSRPKAATTLRVHVVAE